MPRLATASFVALLLGAAAVFELERRFYRYVKGATT